MTAVMLIINYYNINIINNGFFVDLPLTYQKYFDFHAYSVDTHLWRINHHYECLN